MIPVANKKILNDSRLAASVYKIILLSLVALFSIITIQVFMSRQFIIPLEIITTIIFIPLLIFSGRYLYAHINYHYSAWEKVYEKLFQKNPHPMWVYDLRTLQFLMVNDAAAALYGYNKNEFLRMTIKDIRPEEDVPALISETDRIKLNFNLDYHWSGTWRHQKKNAELMFVEISSHEIIYEGKKAELVLAYNVTDKINQDLKLQVLNRDLERKVINRTNDLLQLNRKLVDQNKLIKAANLELYSITNQLKEANEKIQEHTDVKNKFISMVSHEFRTPLLSIKSTADYLRRYQEKTTKKEIMVKVNGIENQVNNMTHLLEDILTIGKNENRKIEIKASEVNIRDFGSKITEDVQSAMNIVNHQHKIIFSVDESVPEFIVSDEKLLKNIFTNLLTNAIKYSPGQDEVYFDIRCIGKKLECSVRDKGIGVDVAEISKIFEPFYRMNSTINLPGTGLGLAIVKKAADLIKATVSVESEISKGTTFNVTIPI